MIAWLKSILTVRKDPVKRCALYLDKKAGSCAHVDGPLCDFPTCAMLKDYRTFKAAQRGKEQEK